jgi:hypothetical protein
MFTVSCGLHDIDERHDDTDDRDNNIHNSNNVFQHLFAGLSFLLSIVYLLRTLEALVCTHTAKRPNRTTVMATLRARSFWLQAYFNYRTNVPQGQG